MPRRRDVPLPMESNSGTTSSVSEAPAAAPVVEYYTYEDFPIEDLLLYAGVDCIATTGLEEKFAPLLDATPDYIEVEAGKRKVVKAIPMRWTIDNVERKCLEFAIDMEINGIRYDVAENRRLSAFMTARCAELEDRIFSGEGYGKKFEINGTNIAQILYWEKGFTAPYKTASGEPSTDGGALKHLAEEHGLEWLGWLAERNDINAAYNTFIRTYVEDFVKRDGRLHPTYNLHGTSSFRISGEYPNLTQLPRTRYGCNIRNCYITDDGYVFIAFDFSSAEVKLLGALSRDPMLLKAIEEGLDFHSFSASQMMGIDYAEFIGILEDRQHPLHKQYKEERQRSKVLTFSLLYGSTAGGIAMQLGISKQEAERIMALYFSKFPLIQQYIEDTHEMARLNHYVTTPFGQRKMEFGTMDMFKKTAVYNAALRNGQNVFSGVVDYTGDIPVLSM